MIATYGQFGVPQDDPDDRPVTFGPVDSDSPDADHVAFGVVGDNGFRVTACAVFAATSGGVADTSQEIGPTADASPVKRPERVSIGVSGRSGVDRRCPPPAGREVIITLSGPATVCRRRSRGLAGEELGVSTELQRAAFVAMYNRTSSGGLIGLAVVLIVIGAIMRFAVTVTTSGFNIHKVGDILLLVGILLAILSIVLIVMSSRRRVTTRTDIRGTPTGEQRVQERQDWGGDPY
jgi:uncharacterized protein DUF6458